MTAPLQIDLLALVAAAAAGLVLGAGYCAMLWLAVRRFGAARHPALWLAGSAVPRLALPLLGFYWVMDGSWQRLTACLAGFVLARLIVQQRVGLPRSKRAVAP